MDRTRMLRGRALEEYKTSWAAWHAKYDRYQTRDGKHKLNSISRAGDRAECSCRTQFVNAPSEAALLDAFEEHIRENEPPIIDVSGGP